MKKLLPIILALMILLTACGTKTAKVEEAPAQEAIAQTSPEANVDPTSSPKSNALTKEKYIESLDPYLEKQGYTTIGSITPSAYDDDKGVTGYTYKMCPGFTLILYENNETKELVHMYMSIDKDIISVEDIAFFGFLSSMEIKWLEGENSDSIVSGLDLVTISKDHVNSIDGNFSYSYIVTGSKVMFSAVPR